jgi:hypothetical protein
VRIDWHNKTEWKVSTEVDQFQPVRDTVMVRHTRFLEAVVAPLLLVSITSLIIGLIDTELVIRSPRRELGRSSKIETKRMSFQLAYSIKSTGNQRTDDFLEWVRTEHPQHPFYAMVALDDIGNVVWLDVDVCYSIPNDELKRISELPRLAGLHCYSPEITDDGLQNLETTCSLKELALSGVSRERVTVDAIQRLKNANPSLKLELSYK